LVVKGGGRLGAVAAGVAAVVVAGSAAAVLSGGGGGADERSAGSKQKTETSEPKPGAAAPAVTEPDPLCVAHQAREAAITALGTVDSPADRQAFVLAELTFYSDAAGHEPEPDATAFRMLAQYFDALRVFYETRSWENADLTEITEMPRPPAGDSATRTGEVLAQRCGVSGPTDTPVETTP
jgi:hypothetical protein